MQDDEQREESGAEKDQRASKQEGIEKGDGATPPRPGGGKSPSGDERGTEAG